jgi:hypothetical protein
MLINYYAQKCMHIIRMQHEGENQIYNGSRNLNGPNNKIKNEI